MGPQVAREAQGQAVHPGGLAGVAGSSADQAQPLSQEEDGSLWLMR